MIAADAPAPSPAPRPRELAGAAVLAAPERFAQIIAGAEPVVLRGLVDDWAALAPGRASPQALCAYLKGFDSGQSLDAFFGDPAIAGKYYYAEGLKGFNFERRRVTFGEGLDAILANLDQPGAQTVYMGSAPADHYMPAFAQANPMPLLPANVSPRLWIGHASNVSCHYDAVDNLVCVVAGKRRFTLYAPDLIDRLYVGPIDNTLAGQPVSLAASAAPGDPRYPRFEGVRDQALVIELEPGDALYMPKLWWHKVEAGAAFNAMINYWWDATAAGPDQPYAALLLTMITLSERPERERQAWRAFFDHYAFRTQGHPLDHLPAEHHGLLGPLKGGAYGKLRARIMHMLRGG